MATRKSRGSAVALDTMVKGVGLFIFTTEGICTPLVYTAICHTHTPACCDRAINSSPEFIRGMRFTILFLAGVTEFFVYHMRERACHHCPCKLRRQRQRHAHWHAPLRVLRRSLAHFILDLIDIYARTPSPIEKQTYSDSGHVSETWRQTRAVHVARSDK